MAAKVRGSLITSLQSSALKFKFMRIQTSPRGLCIHGNTNQRDLRKADQYAHHPPVKTACFPCLQCFCINQNKLIMSWKMSWNTCNMLWKVEKYILNTFVPKFKPSSLSCSFAHIFVFTYKDKTDNTEGWKCFSVARFFFLQNMHSDSRGEVLEMLSASSSAWGSSCGCWHFRSFLSDLLSLHRSTWSLSFCTAHTSPRSTSGIYSCSSTLSQLCAPPQPGHTLHTASCSSVSPICSSSCPSWGTHGPLCPASPECGFPGSNLGSLPGEPAPCERWS